MVRTREIILLAHSHKLVYPRLDHRYPTTQDVSGYYMGYMGTREPANHSKDRKLPDVEKSFSRKAATKEVNY